LSPGRGAAKDAARYRMSIRMTLAYVAAAYLIEHVMGFF
jgi:hypothetical protein